jgi:hypothetical protein
MDVESNESILPVDARVRFGSYLMESRVISTERDGETDGIASLPQGLLE